MKKEDIDKWFRRVKLDENNQIAYPIEFIEAEKITQENAKEFFFSFECNPNYIARENLNDEWWKLNIPQEMIVLWTSEYYEKDILNYESMNISEKFTYMNKLYGVLNQLKTSFIIDITKKYLKLLEHPDLSHYNEIRKRSIADTFITYFKGGSVSYKDGKITEERFEGYIPKLVEINEHDLAKIMLNKLTRFLLESSEAFNGSGRFSLAYYYDILMRFNNKYGLNFQSIIIQIKTETLYSGSYL